MVAQTYYVNESMAPVANGEDVPPSGHRRRSCWSRRTSLEKVLLVALVLLTVFVLVLVVLMVILAKDLAQQHHQPTNKTEAYSAAYNAVHNESCNSTCDTHPGALSASCNATCNTYECIATGYRILENMNQNADPCQDFHQYACGGWIARNTHKAHTSYSIFSNELSNSVNSHLKILLEMYEEEDSEPGAFQKVRDFYSSCMLVTAIEQQGFRPAKVLLDTIGKIHDNETWTEGAVDLTELLYRLLLTNGAPFFDIGREESNDDPNQEIIVALKAYRDARHEMAEETKMATVLESSTLEEQRSVVRFLWVQGKTATQIHAEMETVYKKALAGKTFFNDDEIALPSLSENLQDYKRIQAVNHEIAQKMRLGNFDTAEIDTESVDPDGHSTDDDGVYGEFFELLQSLNVTLDGTLIYRNMKISIDQKADERSHEILRKYFERPATDPRQEAIEKEFSAFIGELRQIIPFPKQFRIANDQDETHRTFTIGSLQKMLNQIDWKALFKKLFKRTFRDEELVEVQYSPYLEALQKLFDNYHPRVIHNAALTLFARDVLWELVNVLKEEGDDRWQFCMEKTKKALPAALSAMYVRDFDRDDLRSTQEEVQEMFNLFKRSLVQRIEEKDWLDQESKSIAKQKVENMTGFFVNSDMLYNDTFIDETVKNIKIEEHRFFDNVISSYVQSRMDAYNVNISHIGEVSIENDALASPFVVNAYYIPNFNKIVLPLAILTPPFYSHDQPKFITFSNLGNTIGHEITHGFDTTGIKYNLEGQRRPWLTNSSQQQFRARTQCMADMYGNTFAQMVDFLDQNVKIKFDGHFTLDENLADIAGIQMAYQAYQLWQEQHGEEMLLPGLELTREQVFFLSAAQSSCSIMTPIAYIFSLELDNHTPEPERVNGILMNSQRFAEAFHCPVGSMMNPTTKCEVW